MGDKRGRKKRKPKRMDNRPARERTANQGRAGKRVRNSKGPLGILSLPMSSNNGTSDEEIANNGNVPRGRGDSGLLLTNPKEFNKDIALCKKAVDKGWNVRRKQMIRRRLEDIVEKETADVLTKDGEVYNCESKADDLAIKAAKVLVQMDGQDLTRIKDSKELPPTPPALPSTVIYAGDGSRIDVDRRTVELARLAERWGTGELVIEGQKVAPSDIIKQADRVPEEKPAAEPDSRPSADKTAPEAEGVPEFDLRGSFIRRGSRRGED